MEKTRLDIEHVTAGMRLAEPISNAAGITLMPAGIRLTPMFIARIKKWNITALEVFADKVPDGAAEGGTAEKTADSVRIRPASRSSTSISRSKEEFARNIAAEVAKVFSGVRDNQLMMNLRSAVIRRLVAKGPRSTINELRRGPPDEAPLPLPLPPAEGD